MNHLKSFAAFVQRGLSEWEKLTDYLEERTLVIRDRRFIYSLFGAFNGFFSLSKTMTDHTGIPACDLVKFIDDMLLHIKNLSYDNATEQRDLKDSVEEVVLNENFKKTDKKKIKEALDLEAKQGSTRAFLFILNNLISSRTKTYKELKKQLDESEDSVSLLRDRVYSILRSIKVSPDHVKAVEEALELEQEIGNPKALCYMLDDMKLSEEIQKKFYEYFNIPYKNESKDKNKKDKNGSKATGIKETFVHVKEQIKGLFDDQTLDELQQDFSSFEIKQSSHFYNDPDAWYYIENLIPSDDTCSKIKSDLEWFQEIMQRPQGQRGYSYDSINENNDKDVIEKFCSLKMGKDKAGMPKAPYFTYTLRELIKQKLFSIYCK